MRWCVRLLSLPQCVSDTITSLSLSLSPSPSLPLSPSLSRQRCGEPPLSSALAAVRAQAVRCAALVLRGRLSCHLAPAPAGSWPPLLRALLEPGLLPAGFLPELIQELLLHEEGALKQVGAAEKSDRNIRRATAPGTTQRWSRLYDFFRK